MAAKLFVGMRLEAHDLENLSLVCVATVKQVQDDIIKIHFDRWGSQYDYSCKKSCALIHPALWCEKSLRAPVNKPQGYEGKFTWSQYLEENEFIAVPEHFFTPSQRRSKQFFEGMRLEATDRRNYKTYIATISEYRYLCQNGVYSTQELHICFDGKPGREYWCESEHIDIHPVGWCKKNGVELQNYLGQNNFRWSEYLSEVKAEAATPCLFTKEQGGNKDEDYVEGDDEDYESETETVKQSFEIDMKLEAEDPSNSSVFYVATVSDVSIKKDIHLQLDGCRKQYWCSSYSTKIHPIGWCEKRNIKINPPKDYEGESSWEKYLKECGKHAAPCECFTKEQQM